jgi:aspartate racemase
VIGVLGGMGPLATADFFAKVLAATPASGDADHVPLLILSDPRIPPRPAAILARGESPLPALRAARDRLLHAGATALVMPCNTAHYWYDALRQDCPVPFLSIVEAACNEIGALASAGDRVAIIATRATLASRLFDTQIVAMGFVPVLPTEQQLALEILPAIETVKRGDLQGGGKLLNSLVGRLLADGAAAVMLACTEVPLALDAVQSPLRNRCIDSTAALARACVVHWQQAGSK